MQSASPAAPVSVSTGESPQSRQIMATFQAKVTGLRTMEAVVGKGELVFDRRSKRERARASLGYLSTDWPPERKFEPHANEAAN